MASGASSSGARAPMNIMFPLGGVGKRFTEQGYRYPKPLVNVLGRPMLFLIFDQLQFVDGDVIWIGIRDHTEQQFNIFGRLQHEYPRLDLRLVLLHYDTLGAAETLFCMTKAFEEEHMHMRTTSLDCATVYWSDVLSLVRAVPTERHATCFFEDTLDTGTKRVFSYLKLDRSIELPSAADAKAEVTTVDMSPRPAPGVLPPESQGLVVDMKEKQAISRYANTGCYSFSSATSLLKYCQLVLDEGLTRSGEYFTSNLYRYMLMHTKDQIQAIHVPKFSSLGTPEQLDDFFKLVSENRFQFQKKLRICFDLDSTLVTSPTVAGDYSTCKPIERNIKLARVLSSVGHTIIIHTARRMRTHSGNVGAVLKDIGMVTLKQLEEFSIPCDEIYFGKPYAHLYVDDVAYIDTAKEIGWLDEAKGSDHHQKREMAKAAFQEPRDCHQLQLRGDTVIKSGDVQTMAGEEYYYRNIPAKLSDLFATLIDSDCTGSQVTMVLSRVRGIPMSFLAAAGTCTVGRVRLLLQGLKKLHEAVNVNKTEEAAAEEKSVKDIDIYANYAAKLERRYSQHKDSVYQRLPEAASIYETLMEHHREYQQKQRAQFCDCIHGDPVFSNVLLTRASRVVFIDMRGQVGDTLTLAGDCTYDIAKVFQSLCGYDVAVHGGTEAGMAKLRNSTEPFFWEYLKTAYPSILPRDVKLITASLLFTLQPLHAGASADPYRRLLWDLCLRLVKETE